MRTNGGSARWPSQLQNEQLEHAPRAKPNFCALLFCKRTAGFPSPPESSTCRFDFWIWVILLILKIICFCYPNSFSLSIETVRSVFSPLFLFGYHYFQSSSLSLFSQRNLHFMLRCVLFRKRSRSDSEDCISACIEKIVSEFGTWIR